jgi:hypothetical protein
MLWRRGRLGQDEMGGEPVLHRRTQRGMRYWQCVVNMPSTGCSLVHLCHMQWEQQQCLLPGAVRRQKVTPWDVPCLATL